MADEQKGKPWNLIIGGIVIVALFAAWFVLPVNEWLETFSHWIEGLGFWGYVLFVAVYVLACLVLAPGAPLTIAAGLVFGLAWGFLVVMTGATIGACLAFSGRPLSGEREGEEPARRQAEIRGGGESNLRRRLESSAADASFAARALQFAELFFRHHRNPVLAIRRIDLRRHHARLPAVPVHRCGRPRTERR